MPSESNMGPNTYQRSRSNHIASDYKNSPRMDLRAPVHSENEVIQSLPIPEYKMGWIVGKKGSYINQLSRKSGATLTISESTSKEYGFVWKYVQIKGTGRAVDRAKKLLHIRLERLEPRSDVAEKTLDDAAVDQEDYLPSAISDVEGLKGDIGAKGAAGNGEGDDDAIISSYDYKIVQQGRNTPVNIERDTGTSHYPFGNVTLAERTEQDEHAHYSKA
jgi:hypothetical protein